MLVLAPYGVFVGQRPTISLTAGLGPPVNSGSLSLSLDAGARLPLQAAAPAPAPGAAQNGADVLFIMEADQVRVSRKA